jgi:hypothetical protein
MMPVSAGGFIEGPERDRNWHKVDHESDQDQERRSLVWPSRD